MRAESLHRVLWIFAAIFLLQVFAARAGQPSSIQVEFHGFEQRTSELHRQNIDGTLSEQAYAHGIETAYDTAFSRYQKPAALADLSTHEIELMFRAASTAAFYGNRPEYAKDMALDLGELEHRQAASTAEYRDMFKTYVAARDFDRARMLLSAHPLEDVPQLPRILPSEASGPDHEASELVVTKGAGVLARQPVDLDVGRLVIVVAHPLCHFTQNAVAAIDSDPELRRLFVANVKWLAPQDQTLDFDLFRAWNAAHPEHPMTIAYRQSGFPMIDDWDTPTFYFLHDGKIVATVMGWPKEGHKAELLAAFAALKAASTVPATKP